MCPLNFGHPLLGLLYLILHMPILMNLSFLSTLTIGLYFIHAAHRHQKKRMFDLGFSEDLKQDLRPPIGPGEEVWRKLGRAILSQDHLSENVLRS